MSMIFGIGGGSGGGTWGTITGTLSNQTDLQAALDAKAPKDSPTFTTLTNYAYATASRVAIFDASKNLVSSSVTTTTLAFLDATSSIQTQLNSKGSGTITGSGTATFFPVFTGSSAIGNSSWNKSTNGGIAYSLTAWTAFKGTITEPLIQWIPDSGGGDHQAGIYTLSNGQVNFVTNNADTMALDNGNGMRIRCDDLTASYVRFSAGSFTANIIGSGTASGGVADLLFQASQAAEANNGGPSFYLRSYTGQQRAKFFGDNSSDLLKISGKSSIGLTIDSSGNVALPTLTASLPVFTDTSKNLITKTIAAARSALNASADRNSFVFRPGGTAGGNVYVTWAALYADLILTSGNRVVFFDNTFTDPVTIPAGTYTGMSGVVFTSANQVIINSVEVDLADGVTFDELPILQSINLVSISSSPVISLSGASRTWYLDKESTISSENAEFAKLDSSGVILFLITASNVSNAGINTFNMINSSELIIYLEEAANVSASCFEDDGSGNILGFLASAGANFDSGQPDFSGSLSVNLSEDAKFVQYNPNGNEISVQEGIQSLTVELDRQTLLAAATYTMPDKTAAAHIHSAGTLLTLTVKLPANPNHGQFAYFSFDHIITTLTVSPNTGQTLIGTAPTTAAVGGHFAYRYDSTDKTWWPT